MIGTRVLPDATVEFRPIGRLDWIGAVHLRGAIGSWLRARMTLVIDLRMVDFIDTDGITEVEGCIRLVHAYGGSVLVCNAARDVESILAMSRVLRLLATKNSTQGTPPCWPDHARRSLTECVQWSDEGAVGRRGWYY